ncbi:DUF1697 domain-containing protein [Nocardioides sp. SYSU D00038]|uniref:DUF1697 domain-containing protein n=1 Tax=Nocardioides sp. SYSU D00038 TaxID=2812554 RepID=UPI001967AF9F|nr:DUF1697 domain-containing protein [Nocardioides sp. SYSU D00038]
MPTYVAFLRAINLGARRKFPKDAIVAAAEGAGFADVATYINTGNVRVTTPLRSRAEVETALEAAFLADRGFAVPTIVLTPAEVVAIVEEADRIDHDGRHYVSLLKSEPSPEDVALLAAHDSETERSVVSGRAVHLLLGDAYQAARITNDTVEKRLGVATNRTISVIRAVAERWC